MSVPSFRSDIFKSRTLSPGDKRALMRFLKSTMEALAGGGPLKVHLTVADQSLLRSEDPLPVSAARMPQQGVCHWKKLAGAF